MYGSRVINMYVQDCVPGGVTMLLGIGSANFDAVFTAIAQINYLSNFILQTARAADGNYADALYIIVI